MSGFKYLQGNRSIGDSTRGEKDTIDPVKGLGLESRAELGDRIMVNAAQKVLQYGQGLTNFSNFEDFFNINSI